MAFLLQKISKDDGFPESKKMVSDENQKKKETKKRSKRNKEKRN